MEIILIRHGKPAFQPLERVNSTEFAQWVQNYNASGLDSSSLPPMKIKQDALTRYVLVCSALTRSIESAQTLNADKIVLSDALFNEAGLPTLNGRGLSWLTLSPRIWAVILRGLWLFGYANQTESFKEAQLRAAKAASQLQSLAQQHKNILLVGHGIFNRMLAKELSRMGWHGSKKLKSKHWSYATYHKAP